MLPRKRAEGERSATWEDLKRLLWAVGLIELVVAGLAILTHGYFGSRHALIVGLVLVGLVFVAFALVVVFSLVATWLVERVSDETRRDVQRERGSPPRRRELP